MTDFSLPRLPTYNLYDLYFICVTRSGNYYYALGFNSDEVTSYVIVPFTLAGIVDDTFNA